MRPPQKNRNNRNKNNGRKPQGNVQNRVYESAGPEGKVRGTPQQIIEKYQILARDAQTSGDRVMAENFLQHAEHYVRLLGAATPQQDDRRLPQNGGRYDGDEGDEDDLQDARQRSGQPERHEDERGRNGGDHPRRDEARAEHPRGDHQRADHARVEGGRPEARHDAARDGARSEHARHDGADRQRSDGADRPRRDDDARTVAPAASALETIDTGPEDGSGDLGPVATPESHAEERPRRQRGPRRAEPEAAAAAPESPAPAAADAPSAAADGAPPQADAPEAAAEPRRRRRRAPKTASADDASGAEGAPAAEVDAG